MTDPALLTGVGPARLHGAQAWATVAACALACVPAGVRWLRVAQREHYLAGSVSRFAVRWWRLPPVNPLLAAGALGAAVASWWWPLTGLAVAAAVAAGPLGLSLRGRTAPLAWTRRLRTLAAVAAGLALVALAAGALAGPASAVAVLVALAVPGVVDLACLLTAPLELRLGGRFVDEAAARLARVAPQVVAVTGSYGKTSTKGHIAHLLRPTRSVVATPASFNNRAGLARAVNEHLADGTEVFVAEMGTYGPGEIAELCRWCPPDISVVTAIGPVHLERFGSEERIVEAKAEILASARDIVIQVDDPRLAAVADRMAGEGRRVLRCSATDRGADVCVMRGEDAGRVTTSVGGEVLAADVPVPSGVHPTNLACAVAVALLCKVDRDDIAERIHSLPTVEHRLQAVRSGAGATIIDDTYNSNPSGAAAALDCARRGRPRDRWWPPGGGHPRHGRARGPPGRGEPPVRRGGRRGGHRRDRRRAHQPPRRWWPVSPPCRARRLRCTWSPTVTGRRGGCGHSSVPTTSCCTRTICRTTTLRPSRSRPRRGAAGSRPARRSEESAHRVRRRRHLRRSVAGARRQRAHRPPGRPRPPPW